MKLLYEERKITKVQCHKQASYVTFHTYYCSSKKHDDILSKTFPPFLPTRRKPAFVNNVSQLFGRSKKKMGQKLQCTKKN